MFSRRLQEALGFLPFFPSLFFSGKVLPSIFSPAIHLNFSSSFLCPISPRLTAMPRPRLSFSPSCPSTVRRVDELAPSFIPSFPLTSHSIISLRSFALLIHFTTVILSLSISLFFSISLLYLSSSFFLSLGRSIASFSTIRSPPLATLFLLRCLVPFTRSLCLSVPSCLRRYFLMAPFASTAIRCCYYSFLFFLFFLAFFLLTLTTGRDTYPSLLLRFSLS